MGWGVLAELVVVFHALFVVFVAAGGLLALRWGKVALVHLPAVLWAVAVECMGWICPLTPLENKLRSLAGARGYQGGFLEQHIVPVLYPEALSRDLQLSLAGGLLALNSLVYFLLARKARQRRKLLQGALSRRVTPRGWDP